MCNNPNCTCDHTDPNHLCKCKTEKYVCSDCGTELTLDNVFLCDNCGNYFCEDCFYVEQNVCINCYDNLHECSHCMKSTNNPITCSCGETVGCNDCAVKCSECGEIFIIDCPNCDVERCSICEEYYCSDCNDNMYTCDVCGSRYCESCHNNGGSHCDQCDRTFCPDCYDNISFYECDNCGEWVCEDCVVHLANGVYCSYCRDHEISAFTCDCCDEEFDADKENYTVCSVCGATYCESCSDEYIYYCENCNSAICQDCIDDESVKCDNCGDIYCNHCAERHLTETEDGRFLCDSCYEEYEENNDEEEYEDDNDETDE